MCTGFGDKLISFAGVPIEAVGDVHSALLLPGLFFYVYIDIPEAPHHRPQTPPTEIPTAKNPIHEHNPITPNHHI